MKRYRKKHGLPDLKYMAVFEYKKPKRNQKSIRMHHHIVINDMDRDEVEKIWKKGRANADRLKADDTGYEALARYMTKDPQGNKRWMQSRNLKQPDIKINDYKYSKRKVIELFKLADDNRTFEKLYKGYYFTDCKAEINQINDGVYLHIRMRKIQI